MEYDKNWSKIKIEGIQSKLIDSSLKGFVIWVDVLSKIISDCFWLFEIIS